LSKPDGSAAYVACEKDEALAIVDTADPSAEARRVPLGEATPTASASDVDSRSVALAPSGDELIVANGASMDLNRVDTTAESVLGDPWSLPGARGAVWSPDGSKIVVTTRAPDGVSILDAATGAVVASRAFSISECEAPHEAAFGAHALYVLCSGSSENGAVVMLDPSSPDLSVGATYAVGDRAEGFLVLSP
jgi:DNA-binding beta-propeller fold protein YncE